MTEITLHDNNIDVLPPARPMASQAIQQLMAHAEAMSAAKQLGTALAATDMVPKDYKGNPANAAAAILYGAELGLSPIQSLQQIFIVHGRPAIYARTAVALVMRHGITVETVETSDQSVTVRATDPRNGHAEECTWDTGRAMTAGYTANDRYKKNAQQMLYAKAAMECCRKIAPDVLLGIAYAREELEMEPAPKRVHAERAWGVAALTERVTPADSDRVNEAAAERPQTMSAEPRRKWMNRMFALLADGDCTDRDDQLIVLTYLAGRDSADMLEHRDQLSDKELRNVVTMLHDYNKAGELGATITEILNTHTINTEPGTAATTPEEN